MNNLKITIVTIVLNDVTNIEETINSVLEQTYDNIEFIVIDGGSIDGTIDIVKKYKDQIDIFISEKDNGIYDAMNKGIRNSSGNWLNFMNSGDRFTNVNVIKNAMKNTNNADLIYSDTLFSNNKIFFCDISKNRIIHQSLIYKKELHEKFGLYLVAKGVTISDYLFFMQCKNENWKKIDEKISIFNLDGTSSNLNHFKQKIAIDILFNNVSRFNASMFLLIHPLYSKIKRFFL